MSEKNLQVAVTTYLKLAWPKVIYRSDLGGIKLTIGQAVQVKKIQQSRAFPDLFIAEPRGRAHGMFLELKKAGETVFLKNGSLSKDKHIQEQAEMLMELRKRGYVTNFAIGFDDAKKQIDEYLNCPV